MCVEETSLTAWRKIIKNRSVEKDLIFHGFTTSTKTLKPDRDVNYGS
jgi:hypothetical protein